ncbi:MAG: UDP-2,3-diacylglucosamine diphosphatase [Bacteroidetes bacterium]|nr:UDP-2,3-diacylglucosamine diphosphatase [Bacteroidota bacterium]
MPKKIYFASDFHLGVPDYESSLIREKVLVQWLEEIHKDAEEIYLMGDLFDFWFEYRTVVPRGYVRLLGKLAEISDSGTAIHLFTGNHDMWTFGYLTKEVNIQLHRNPEIRTFGNKTFYLAHGDGLGPGDHGYKFIKKIFRFSLNKWLFRWIHPDIGIAMGLFWSRRSRKADLSRNDKSEREKKLIRERLLVHSKTISEAHPEIDYFIYGHLHYPMEIPVNEKSTQVTLGDWMTHFTYAEFDGEVLKLLPYKGEAVLSDSL